MTEWTEEMPSPLASPQNKCEVAYLAWMSATYVFEGVNPMFEADVIDPLYRACTVAQLANASSLYPKHGCIDPPDSCAYTPVFFD